jgi:hypothetical protein
MKKKQLTEKTINLPNGTELEITRDTNESGETLIIVIASRADGEFTYRTKNVKPKLISTPDDQTFNDVYWGKTQQHRTIFLPSGKTMTFGLRDQEVIALVFPTHPIYRLDRDRYGHISKWAASLVDKYTITMRQRPTPQPDPLIAAGKVLAEVADLEGVNVDRGILAALEAANEYFLLALVRKALERPNCPKCGLDDTRLTDDLTISDRVGYRRCMYCDHEFHI